MICSMSYSYHSCVACKRELTRWPGEMSCLWTRGTESQCTSRIPCLAGNRSARLAYRGTETTIHHTSTLGMSQTTKPARISIIILLSDQKKNEFNINSRFYTKACEIFHVGYGRGDGGRHFWNLIIIGTTPKLLLMQYFWSNFLWIEHQLKNIFIRACWNYAV